MNTAIITDTALLEADALLEQKVVTPSTLFALNNLAQAVVLHEKVILGLSGFVGGRHDGIDRIHQSLGTSLATRPEGHHLATLGFADIDSKVFYWAATEGVVVANSAEAELGHFSAVGDFLRAAQLSDITENDALSARFGIKKQFGSKEAVVDDLELLSAFNAQVKAKGGEPLSPNDLLSLRDIAWGAAAGTVFAHTAGMEVYHALIERPFYGSALRQPNGPLALVRAAVAEMEFECGDYKEVKVPMFLSLLLSHERFRRDHFWEILLELREQYRPLRVSISQFKEGWRNAKTLGEQRGLMLDQDRAWNALLAREKLVREDRILYTIGRAAKSAGKSLLDDLVKRDEFDQAMKYCGGLVRFWEDLQAAIPTTEGRRAVQQHFGAVPAPQHWQRILAQVAQVNSAANLIK